MAYSVREERQSLANSLREDLGEAERKIVQLRRDNVEQFLQLLDLIEDRFAQLESSGLDLRPEFTRWGSLQSKLQREARRIVRVIDVAGGLDRLRQANPPAEGLWWHLDAVVAEAPPPPGPPFEHHIRHHRLLAGGNLGPAYLRLSP